MLFATVSAVALALLATVSAVPVAEAGTDIEARASKNCHTLISGYLVGHGINDTEFRFVYNSKHEVAYDPDWKKSKKQLKVQFQQCPNYKDPIGDEDGAGYVGRMYVPSLGGCVSNPAYAKSLNTEYYPVVTSCKKTTAKVGETELWKYYPSSDGDNNYRFVYWAAFPNRLRPGCYGLYGYKLDGKADQHPYTRPGHNGAIDFKCDASNNRFFVSGSD